MGGRGSSAGIAFRPLVGVPNDLPYDVVSYASRLGGAAYPLLTQTSRAWHLLTRPVGEPANYHPAHTFGLAQPTLRWVSASHVSELYIDGMTTEQFLQQTGLQLSLDKGAYVLSKRLSRLMRPYFWSGLFDPAAVQIRYLDELGRDGRKIWDGAGLVSRAMLEKMVLPAEMEPARRERLLAEIRRAQRVEFTILTAAGQDKGHAIVVDDLDVDFVLPRDTKGEVSLWSGHTFVGLSVVHGRDDMRLDIQSLINLHPFFAEEQLLGWLHEEGELFLQSVESGQVAEVMGRIDRHTTLEDVKSWHLREYLACGGQPMWFRSHVKSLINQHLERLNHVMLEKMRLPIPGGRYYVMPVGVGQEAGSTLNVPPGYIHLDKGRGTAWVNDEDWLALPDSPKEVGIAGILGGADNDDALWLHPFTDYDGERKMLAWRSPNQAGEYVLLRPTAGSHPLSWITTEGLAESYPPGDSRRLPLQIDHVEPHYLGLVDPTTAGGLGEGQTYTVGVMDAAIERAVANQGALGMYCNSLMVNKALYGQLPDSPPAPLEAIIDSSVKTGADLSQVIAWNYQNSNEILQSRIPIPLLLHGRLSYERGDSSPPPVPSKDHWLDGLVGGVRQHIAFVTTRRDELASQARPLQALFDSAAEDPEAIQIGQGLNRVYARTIARLAQARTLKLLLPADYEVARQAVEDYLASYPPHRHTAILRGVLVSTYLGETATSDAAAWIPGEKSDTGRLPGIAQKSLDALREIGLLDEIAETAGGVLVYPNAAPQRPFRQVVKEPET